MAYADVTVLVDGVVDIMERFHDEILMDERFKEIKEDAESDGYLTEVFVARHEHNVLPAGKKCRCENTDEPFVTYNDR
jgi:hypothetical protein